MLGIEKKPWNMKVTIIPIIIGALGTVIKKLIKVREEFEIRRLEETIKTIEFVRSARNLKRVLETREDLLSFRLQ